MVTDDYYNSLSDYEDYMRGDEEETDPDFDCCFPDRCLMGGLHYRSECYTAEGMEAYNEECRQADEEYQPTHQEADHASDR